MSKNKSVASHLNNCPRCRNKQRVLEGVDTIEENRKPLSPGFADSVFSNLRPVKDAQGDFLGEIREVLGSVLLYRGSSDTGEEIYPGTGLVNEDTLKVCGDSLALVELKDGSTIYLNKNTDITLSSDKYPLILDSGKLFAMMKPQKNLFEIKTPSAVLGVIGTEFDAEVTGKGETILKVKKGKVSYTNNSGKTIATRSQQIKASSGTALKTERIRDSREIDTWTKPINPKKEGGSRPYLKVVAAILSIAIVLAGFLVYKSNNQSTEELAVQDSAVRSYIIKNRLFSDEILYNVSLISENPNVQNLPVATQIYTIDTDMKTWMAGDINKNNNTANPISGKTFFFNTSLENIIVLNEEGSMLEVIMDPLENKYKVSVMLDEEIMPGESASFTYLSSTGNIQPDSPGSNEYFFEMDNYLGAEAIENFCLVLPPYFEIIEVSEEPVSVKELGLRKLITWQKHVTADETHRTKVEFRFYPEIHEFYTKESEYNRQLLKSPVFLACMEAQIEKGFRNDPFAGLVAGLEASKTFEECLTLLPSSYNWMPVDVLKKMLKNTESDEVERQKAIDFFSSRKTLRVEIKEPTVNSSLAYVYYTNMGEEQEHRTVFIYEDFIWKMYVEPERNGTIEEDLKNIGIIIRENKLVNDFPFIKLIAQEYSSITPNNWYNPGKTFNTLKENLELHTNLINNAGGSGPAILSYPKKDELIREHILDNLNWLQSINNGAVRLKNDSELTDEDINSPKLRIYGTPWNHKIYNQINDKLPIKIERNGIIVGSRKILGTDVGVIMACPNPLNRDNIILIYGGVSPEVVYGIHEIHHGPSDFVVFNNQTRDMFKNKTNLQDCFLLLGAFDKSDPENWKVSEELLVYPPDEVLERVEHCIIDL